ncbi:ribonuclease H [Senna tora]|uniref:Ribonuclease H n=1 Tax=Senna tora TaxID=362788 RepID=A0A834TUL8_9FABA|nr:ribonuclease H [Senna tora]
MNKFLIWNCRGAGNSAFTNACRLYIQRFNPNLLALLETKSSVDKSQGLFASLGFTSFHCQQGRGFAGGIWIAWKDDMDRVEVIQSHFQLVHMCVHRKTRPWYLTVVYASPQQDTRQELWDHLCRIGSSQDRDWAVVGDFNDILAAHEKKGGAPFNPRRSNCFQDSINRCNLLDVPSSGPRVYSDHHPLLVNLCNDSNARGERPFRFERAWTLHEGFQSFVAEHWNPILEWNGNMNQFTDATRNWNKHVFGHIGRRKRVLLARIDGIQRACANGINPFLVNLEKEFQHHLSEVLKQEEVCGTKSLAVSGSLKETVILVIIIPRLLLEEEGIESRCLEGRMEVDSRPTIRACHSFPAAEDTAMTLLRSEISEEDIRKALFSMKGDKAPGLDGFPAIFFQSNWKVVKDNFTRTVLEAFSGNLDMASINQSLIVLITEASVDNARVMLSCLDSFGGASGQKVSKSKTKVYFSKNTSRELRRSIKDITNFEETNDLGKYLGMPLLHGRMSRNKYAFILDKV